MLSNIKQLFDDSEDLYCVVYQSSYDSSPPIFKNFTSADRPDCVIFTSTDCKPDDVTKLPFSTLRTALVKNLSGNIYVMDEGLDCLSKYQVARIEKGVLYDRKPLDKAFGESFIDDIGLGKR